MRIKQFLEKIGLYPDEITNEDNPILDYELVYYEEVKQKPYSVIIEDLKVSEVRKEVILK